MEQNARPATDAGMHMEERLTSRTWRIVSPGAVGVLCLLTVAAYAMFVSLPGRVKFAPVSIVVHSSSTLPAEAPFLFVRRTITVHVAYADQRVDAQLERTNEIRSDEYMIVV
jgi:hypothetical protein